MLLGEPTNDDIEQELQQQQVDRLFLNAGIFLRQGRLSEAEEAIDELRKVRPESSEAWELQGDLLRQKGKRRPAQEAYKRAFELDSTNAKAERKYAELVLFISEEHRAAQRQREVVDDPSKYKPERRRSPTLATVYACFFPGFGQLYNRQHEKGLVMLFVAAIILMLLVNAIILAPFRRMAQEAESRGLTYLQQLELWGDQVRQIRWYTWVLSVFGLLSFLTLHVYAIADATIVARQQAKEADRLGVEAPS
jgi:tetratricopeptide (TPR) repeat protein